MSVHRKSRRSRLLSILLAAPFCVGGAMPVAAADQVHLVVLREGAVGSPATIQSYLDRVMEVVGKLNGWKDVEGKFHTDRERAAAYIDSVKPQFGIFTLAAYLAAREASGLSPLGRATIRGGGGEQYHLVSSTVGDAAGCEGKSLATTFSDDARFVDRVVFDGKMSLSKFEVVSMKRPLQPVKAVARGEAVCALLDDAQLAELGRLGEGGAVRPVWSSAKFPAMVVVALPPASPSQTAAFTKSLPKVCAQGPDACAAAGIERLEAGGLDDLQAVTRAYQRGG